MLEWTSRHVHCTTSTSSTTCTTEAAVKPGERLHLVMRLGHWLWPGDWPHERHHPHVVTVTALLGSASANTTVDLSWWPFPPGWPPGPPSASSTPSASSLPATTTTTTTTKPVITKPPISKDKPVATPDLTPSKTSLLPSLTSTAPPPKPSCGINPDWFRLLLPGLEPEECTAGGAQPR